MAMYRAAVVLCLSLTAIHAHDTTLVESLVTRIELLEEQGKMQQSRLQQQDKLLQFYEDRLLTYESTFQEYSKRIQDLEDRQLNEAQHLAEPDTAKTQHALKPSSHHMGLHNDTTNDKMLYALKTNRIRKHVVQDEEHSLNFQKNVKRPRFVLDGGEGPVAFHATNDKAVTTGIGNGQHLIFEDVHVNLGNSFHSLHGTFIAPKGGLYLFSTSVMIQVNQGELVTSIKINGANTAGAYANGVGGTPEQGSVSLVAQLKVGDEVWVASIDRQTSTEYGDKFTSFMGCLLFEM